MLLVFLQKSTVKASDSQDEAASSTDQPQQNVTNAISRLRRKLLYPGRDQTHNENEREMISPLPEMPDLSQATSHLSTRSSPAQVSSPSATSQVSYEMASHFIIKLLFSA